MWIPDFPPQCLHVLCGARFDGIFEACVGNFWKRTEIMKWLVYVLALPNNDSIMQRALFIILRSVQMNVQLRVGSIFFLSILVPMRWLSANTHILEHRKWGENNMACAIDCVYKKSLKIKERPALILQKSFMLSIFSNLYRKLPDIEAANHSFASNLRQSKGRKYDKSRY